MSNTFAITVEVQQFGGSEHEALRVTQQRLARLQAQGLIDLFSVKDAEAIGGRLRRRFAVCVVVDTSTGPELLTALRAEFGAPIQVRYTLLIPSLVPQVAA